MHLYSTPEEIVSSAADKGVHKANTKFSQLLILSFLGGIFISLGFLGYIRVAGNMPEHWGSARTLAGACVFPVGLMAILLGGGELATSNMLVVSIAWFQRRIRLKQLLYNWSVVLFGNFFGAILVAFFIGHYLGLTEGLYLDYTHHFAAAKMDVSFGAALVSGIGCNIFVGLGAWLCYGAQDFTGKILGIWFPIMAFVAIGFQHVIANMFIIPAAIFSGSFDHTWMDFLANIVPVYIGNVIGGAVFLGLEYFLVYRQKDAEKK